MIESEVTDDNELYNGVGDFANEEVQNSSTVAIDSEHNELDSDVDDIEIDALQEDDIKNLKILLSSSFTVSSSIFFCTRS